jgi:hypothetical protein
MGRDYNQTMRAWRLGPFTVERTVSVSGVLAVGMAFVAMVGGWYNFSFRQAATEKRTEVLEQEHEADLVVQEKLTRALDRTNDVLEGVLQALDDNHIHVRTDQVPEVPDDRGDTYP